MLKNILFVCSANKDRSKTAEDYFSEHYPDLNFESAGTNLKLCDVLGTNALSEELQENAELILVMEEKHYKSISAKFKHKTKILHIRDIYKYYQPELITILEEKVKFDL